MKQLECIQSSLPVPDDIALKIASLLQVPDVCALGSCSRFWRELCASESIWESLAKDRWPSLTLFHHSSSSNAIKAPISKGWKGFYIKRHKEVAGKVIAVAKFVELCSQTESLEVRDYLKAIEEVSSTQLGFKDVQMFLFKPKCNVLLNLVGLHYCIHWLGVPGEYVMEALQSCKISDRQVCVKWWKLGRWFYGFRMRDESHSRWVSLADLAMAKEPDVLVVLQRGAIHEVLSVQISVADPTCTPWSCQST
ncbi:F-box-like domain-containing protein [Fagus crenata]